jgi:hypothetical protein
LKSGSLNLLELIGPVQACNGIVFCFTEKWGSKFYISCGRRAARNAGSTYFLNAEYICVIILREALLTSNKISTTLQ